MRKLGLLPKLIISIILGILLGLFIPETFLRVFVTFSELFGSFLKFIVPLMIIGFVVKGISDLTSGAGKLLGITTIFSYVSTIVAGLFAFAVALNLFPNFISQATLDSINNSSVPSLEPYFTIDIPPMIDVTSAIVLSFMLGISISTLRCKKIGDTMYNVFSEFSEIIVHVLNNAVIPLLPVFILGTFANMTYTGQTFKIISVLWKVFIVVILLHTITLLVQFTIAGIVKRQSPIKLMKNQIPGYITALGTQSSAACIPVNIKCAENNGVCEEIRNFVIPLCSNIHMAGSVITITCCVTAVLMMYNMDLSVHIMIPFIMTLGVAMVASPGAPGGSIMSALPFMPLVGISPQGTIASLLIALYITQDSFGTAANVSGDNAIAIMVDSIYKKFIKR